MTVTVTVLAEGRNEDVVLHDGFAYVVQTGTLNLRGVFDLAASKNGRLRFWGWTKEEWFAVREDRITEVTPV